MKYNSINELDKFEYKDCYINEIRFDDKVITFIVEALIVKASNSNNTNYTDSYADVTEIRLDNASINKIIKLGYKRYDADDNLIDEIADVETDLGMKELKALLANAYLTSVSREADNTIKVFVELSDEDPCAITDEYEIDILCSDVTISWDKYLNRVQQM